MGLLSLSTAEAVPLQVYSNDFDGSEAFAGGATGGLSGETGTTGVQGFNGLGASGNQFGGNMLRNTATGNPGASTVLTLNNLPTHDSIDINFLLAVIDSWDSTDGFGCCAPDFLSIKLDGATLVQHTYNNATGSVNDQTGTDIGSGKQHRGFDSGGFGADQAFDASTLSSLNVAHSASTAVIEIFASGAGWQGGTDESFGLDNLGVVINATTTTPPPDGSVPEPATLALLGLGLAGLVVRRRSR